MNSSLALNPQKMNDNLTENIGKHLTIFINGGGHLGQGFSGILTNVNCDYITILKAYEGKTNNCHKHYKRFRGFRRSRNKPVKVKTHIYIPINKITAILHKYEKHDLPQLSQQRSFSNNNSKLNSNRQLINLAVRFLSLMILY